MLTCDYVEQSKADLIQNSALLSTRIC